MRTILYSLLLITLFGVSCGEKQTPVTPPATVPERLEITPTTKSILVSETATFTLKFFDKLGKEAPVPTDVKWSSANNAIATVNQQGVATGVGAGQVEIKATYNAASATGLLTILASTNNNQVATVTIEPTTKEIKLNENSILTAIAKNVSGQVIPGVTFSWKTNDTALVTVSASTGAITGKAYGTTNITATASGINSAPAMVQVIRLSEPFANRSSTGRAKLKIESGVLKLQTSSDFSFSPAPDLRMYLGNDPNNITSAVEIASLTGISGAQSWNVPSGVTITQYRYAFIWCKRFTGNYGTADFGL
jgi:uncharacterized protein YjdB